MLRQAQHERIFWDHPDLQRPAKRSLTRPLVRAAKVGYIMLRASLARSCAAQPPNSDMLVKSNEEDTGGAL